MYRATKVEKIPKRILRRASAYEALEKYPLAYVDYVTVLQIDDSVMHHRDYLGREDLFWTVLLCILAISS